MSDQARLWADPRLIYFVAATAVALLVVTLWLFRRRRRQGRPAAVVCLIVSVILHLALLVLVPMLPSTGPGSLTKDEQVEDPGMDQIAFSTFDPDLDIREQSDELDEDEAALVVPLPITALDELGMLSQEAPSNETADAKRVEDASPPPLQEASPVKPPAEMSVFEELPQITHDQIPAMEQIDDQLASLLDATWVETPEAEPVVSRLSDQEIITEVPVASADEGLHQVEPEPTVEDVATAETSALKGAAHSVEATVAGALEEDFANRRGSAKRLALEQTGGDEQTEAAVEAALRFLVAAQRSDGAWDPRASQAGVERRPLGTARGGAGTRAESALTGLALLALMGAGNTHQNGPYAENVYRGLAYLIRTQQPDGSLAGNANVNAATYCHGMASLAMCEAAALTGDESAMLCSRRAIAYTVRIQHPTTGGWRYVPGDPGDLSQLGWQAMVLDAGHRAGIAIEPRAIGGINRFLHSVRMGAEGGLASYRPGEAPSRTMTAEALATRLLLGNRIPPGEVAEAERYLLQQKPGVGQDNYYYWYYATLALHQLQDDTWRQWNDALKDRLIGTQRSDGHWPANSVWGGYGGTIYSTSMATLCLETYYRHAIRDQNQRIAEQPTLRR